MTRNYHTHRVGQFLITKLGTKTTTRNRRTDSIELELDLDMQTALN